MSTMHRSPTLSILIPAYNEEKTIARTIDSCLIQSEKADKIIVVNDGSKDKTLEILKSYGEQITIVDLAHNTGNKSKAQEIGLQHVDTDLFITADADTRLDVDFVKKMKETFMHNDVSAVCGYVESERNNWLTALRELNYIIGQHIYKKAQNHIGAFFVMSGCASAFKTADFRRVITFDHDNVTEDLDFTYKLKLANRRILFNDEAIVYTQDPNNLKSYFKQMYRWYSGGWTCLKKNVMIIKKPNDALILSLIYVEGLLMSFLALLAPLLWFFFGYTYLLPLLAMDLIVLSGCLLYGIGRSKRYGLFFYIPLYYPIHYCENVILVYTFFTEISLSKRNLVWHKPDRY